MKKIKNVYRVLLLLFVVPAHCMVRTALKPLRAAIRQTQCQPIVKTALKGGALQWALVAGSNTVKAEESQEALLPFEKQRQAFYAQLLAKPWGAVAQKHIALLEQEEKALINEFLNEMKISPQEFEKMQREIAPHMNQRVKEFEQEGKPLNDKTKERIKKVLKQLDLMKDDKLIFLEQKSDNMKVYAHLLYVNERFCWQLDDDELSYTVAHELAHVMHHDVFKGVCIEGIQRFKRAQDNPYLYYMPSHYRPSHHDALFLKKMSHFFELRADVFASLTSIQAACEGHNWHDDKRLEYHDSPSHPSSQKRAERIKIVRDEMILAVYNNKHSHNNA